MKWEYLFLTPQLKDTDGKLGIYWHVDKLDELGDQGWEAVCALGEGKSQALLMKRATKDRLVSQPPINSGKRTV